MRKLMIILFLFSHFAMAAFTQPKTDRHLEKIFSGNTDSLFQRIIGDPGNYRLQVIYTQIDRDSGNRPYFTHHYFNVDPGLYFNPASMVKLPLAILSLEKLKQLEPLGIDRNTPLQFLRSESWQTEMLTDSSAADQRVTIGHLVKRALLISENDPYNRLYQFLGQGPVNQSLRDKGYTHSVITRQFLGLTEDQNRFTNAVVFLDSNGRELYRQVPALNTEPFNFRIKFEVGRAHINPAGQLVNEPFDFTRHNHLGLEDMQQMLQALIFPSSVDPERRFDLADGDRRFLLQYLSQYPSETPYPKYDAKQYYDSYVKFFFHGSKKEMPASVRVFNKVGWSYGFMTDVSYVADFANRVEYMLSATVYVNSDGVVNDDRYDYESVGYPFFYQLGQTIYRHELERKRQFRPDLGDLIIPYEKRDPTDKGALLQNLDN